MSAKGPELKVGEPIPGTKYRVVKSLGAGGMGVVYQVVKPPNIQGVLKLMSTELSQHDEHRMRFFDEVRILAQLEHPNIVRVFDYDALPDGTPFYVMELLSGRTVRDVIYTMGRVPPRVAYEITRQLLEALQAAHTHEVPVIHRDIKPENIFLHAPRHGEPVVKLIDFGVSAVADRKHDGAFVGTWSYAAPEQIRGEKPTPATDLYAAGLVLYEMLAGVGPFDHHGDWAKVSEAQMKEMPAPVSKFAPWVPASIVSLIQAALAKDPRMRPRDAYAFAERLFELEWAIDGNDPHDMTAEGPLPSARPRHAGPAAAAAPAGGPPLEIAGNGPLSRVLSSITSSNKAPSKKMAAASPAKDRLGDVPLIGVPPESVRTGSTWRGVGGRDHTSPDADALLAGLGAAGGKPPSRRERESSPEGAADGSAAIPRAGRVVITPGAPASSHHESVEPTTPRPPAPRGGSGPGAGGAGTAVTLDEVPADGGASAGPAVRDTFSSQQSDARKALPRSRTGLFVLAGALLLGGLVTATIVVVRGTRGDTTTSAVTGATTPGASSTPASPSMPGTPSVAAPASGTASGSSSTVASAPASSDVAPSPSVTDSATLAAPAHSPPSTRPGHKTAPAGKASGGSANTAQPASAATAPATPATTSTGNASSPPPKPTGGGDFIRSF